MSTENTLATIILEKLGIADLPEELQEEFISDIGELIMNAVLVRTSEQMDEAQLEGLVAITNDENKGPEDVFNYLRQHVVNAEEIIIEEGNRILASWEAESNALEI